MKIEKWSVIFRGDEYTPPELCTQHLHGLVYGHPKHVDGTEITTSAIISVACEMVITNSGSVYSPGEVDPAYEAVFPNARERLFSRGQAVKL